MKSDKHSGGRDENFHSTKTFNPNSFGQRARSAVFLARAFTATRETPPNSNCPLALLAAKLESTPSAGHLK